MQGIIFDLDGTLIDSLDDISAALNHTLGELGLPGHTRSEIERFVGDGARMLVRRALPPEAADLEDEVLARFRRRYLDNLVVDTAPFPGVVELLAALERRGVPTAVLSNKPHDATVRIVRSLMPSHPFVDVLGHRPGVPQKPDPTSALELAGAMGLEPARVLFVGDTPVDLRTAERAGMVPVAVTWGMRTPSELAGAAHHVERAAELIELLG